MGVALTISWQGRSAHDFARVFHTTAGISDFSPVLKDIGREVVSPSVAQNFESEGRPAWAPLSPVTIARKQAAGAPRPSAILFHTGKMYEAATNHERYTVNRSMLKAYPKRGPYWIYHQKGGPRLPQRVIMMLQAEDRTKINNMFADFIRTHMVFNPRLAGARQFTGGGVGLGT
jgi:phage gpG-like protein